MSNSFSHEMVWQWSVINWFNCLNVSQKQTLTFMWHLKTLVLGNLMKKVVVVSFQVSFILLIVNSPLFSPGKMSRINGLQVELALE